MSEAGTLAVFECPKVARAISTNRAFRAGGRRVGVPLFGFRENRSFWHIAVKVVDVLSCPQKDLAEVLNDACVVTATVLRIREVLRNTTEQV